MTNKQIAELCHAVNKAFCESIGDNSQPNWDNAPEWQHEAVVSIVKSHMKSNSFNPSDTHDIWMKQKIDAGWTYGEVKDAEKKTHPCIVPYDKLPLHEKTKDYLIKAICDYFKK